MQRVVRRVRLIAFVFAVALVAPLASAAPDQISAAANDSHTGSFTLQQVLDYPFPSGLASSERGDRIAWVIDLRGARNVWVAQAPAFKPRQLTHFTEDDGQEITQLTFSPSGDALVFVRGGDHDANWPDKLAPDPDSNTIEPKAMLWAVRLPDGTVHEITEGDAPAISAQGKLAYVKDDQVWTVALDYRGDAKHPDKDKNGAPKRLFFDRGKDGELQWSPDGTRLAFVSGRDDHAFIGVYSDANSSIEYLAPSTGRDGSPRWSPDGTRIAFTRLPGRGGAPEPLLQQVPHPWSVWTADVASGNGQRVWQSPDTLVGSYPETAGEANLNWAAGDRLVFLSDLDGWPHLYSIAASGGEPLLLTPGHFMVEDVALSRDKRSLVYSANTGSTKDDDDRRHLFEVPVDAAQPRELTPGDGLQWTPVVAGENTIAFIDAGAQQPPLVAAMRVDGSDRHLLQPDLVPNDFPSAQLITPKSVSFTAADGTLVHGQLFRAGNAGANQPGVIFVHGGPPRQMLLGWHYMDYYSNSYAVNQYLAAHGFTVLSVNYRLGIGYGHAFHNPDHSGPTGASEYQDVLAGATFLQHADGVDAQRIGIWGGSYGGYLTALGLARNSDIFKAGVDMHGVHDWSRFIDLWFGKPEARYEQGDRKEAMKVAWESSPDADVASWKSPVLLIQGDDDRNVHFFQTVDLARRLQKQGVPYEELVLPNEIHGFLRHASWLKADQATIEFLKKKLGGG
ncbi:MAG TPA: prolyl oligopeptidase family serine peptidase [Rhodanobacteraceae bacterium]|nr:prolyl oligopeptidase family serine peptidase [Rhodanobacteraceae bacterium]